MRFTGSRKPQTVRPAVVVNWGVAKANPHHTQATAQFTMRSNSQAQAGFEPYKMGLNDVSDPRYPPEQRESEPWIAYILADLGKRSLVGAKRFELLASCTPCKRASRAAPRR